MASVAFEQLDLVDHPTLKAMVEPLADLVKRSPYFDGTLEYDIDPVCLANCLHAIFGRLATLQAAVISRATPSRLGARLALLGILAEKDTLKRVLDKKPAAVLAALSDGLPVWRCVRDPVDKTQLQEFTQQVAACGSLTMALMREMDVLRRKHGKINSCIKVGKAIAEQHYLLTEVILNCDLLRQRPAGDFAEEALQQVQELKGFVGQSHEFLSAKVDSAVQQIVGELNQHKRRLEDVEAESKKRSCSLPSTACSSPRC